MRAGQHVRTLAGLGGLAWAASISGATAAWGQLPPPADSTHKSIVVVWNQVVPLAAEGRVVDVSYANVGLNLVTPVEMVWLLDAGGREMRAVASKPISGTADAGEAMGKRGAGLLHDPAAFCVATAGNFVLETDGRLEILRSGWVDSLALAAPAGPQRDIAVPTGGLVYVLLGPEVRVYEDPPGTSPLWTIRLSPKLLPAVALVVSARGEVYVAGRGTLALAAYELDASGVFRLMRSRTRGEVGLRQLAGIALTPNMLIPIEGREGWVRPDRFVVVADAEKRSLLALEAATLVPLGGVDLATEVPGLVPSRIDVSNRAQIAVVDAARGGASALPARVLARMVEKANVHWRIIQADTTAAAGSSGR